VKKSWSKRVAAPAFLVLLALFLVRPQIGLLRRKTADSLSTELGRPVSVDSVHLRFLPRPGLELGNLSIHDGTELDGEPLLRSPDVNAWLRISSLLRGRLEISSLSLSDASLNLTRSKDGKWNIEELLERASKSSTAPTASSRKEPRREFPYIEADHARINFKNGIEKTRFAFTNAEFALWQESENEWGMRLRARPIRTDANLTDTGVISVSGVWDRAPVLENTPIRVSLEWKQAQIGQVSKLFSGNDQGWRGNALLDANLSGTLGKFTITADASVDQIRREGIAADASLHAAAHCAAEYESSQRVLSNIDCSAPAGDGLLELKGSADGSAFGTYDLKLLAKDFPAQSVLALVRHMKQSVPADLKAAGAINMVLSLSRKDSTALPKIEGEGEALGVRLTSTDTGAELPIGVVPLRLSYAVAAAPVSKPSSQSSSAQTFPELLLGPVSVSLSKASPLQAQVALSRTGYKGSIRGNAGIKRLLQAASILRVPAPSVAAEGAATINLGISRDWNAPASKITGSAQLHSVRAEVRGLNLPLQINRADLMLAADSLQVSNLDASAGPTAWRGSMLLPRPCSADSCSFQFRLRSPQLSAAALNQLLNPSAAKHHWYHLLALGKSSGSFFSSASANGSIAIDRLILGKATCQRFSADLTLTRGKVSLTNAKADFLKGKAAGMFKADFTAHPPEYSGMGQFDEIALADVAHLMGTEWAAGTGSAQYQFTAAGSTLQDWRDRAELKAKFVIKDGVFPHVILTEDGDSLRTNAFAGKVSYSQSNFSFGEAELNSPSGVFKLSGTASIAGALNLRLTSENSPSYEVSGTLLQTRVSPIANPPTQAALKP